MTIALCSMVGDRIITTYPQIEPIVQQLSANFIYAAIDNIKY